MHTEKTATPPGEAAKPDDIRARLAAAKEKKAARSLEQERLHEAQELAILELENSLEDGGKGPRGVNFEIVDGGDSGPIALRLGEMILYKRFTSTMKGDKEPSHEDLFNYVSPCVIHPDRQAFAKLVERKPVLLMRCANALTTLFGAKDEDARENSKGAPGRPARGEPMAGGALASSPHPRRRGRRHRRRRDGRCAAPGGRARVSEADRLLALRVDHG